MYMCTNGISPNARLVLLEEKLGMSKFISFKGKQINKLLDGTGVSLISVLRLCLELLLAVAVQEKMNPNYKPQSRCYFRGTVTYMSLEILISWCVEWHQYWKTTFWLQLEASELTTGSQQNWDHPKTV